MENEANGFSKAFFTTLENGITKLPQHAREELYRPCAIECVRNYVLEIQKKQFMECGGDLDRQYEKYGRSEFFFADIIERGHVYEVGYPRCLCPVVEAGYASNPVHCECSKQSILYVLQTLLPDKQIRVEPIHTVLSGASECRFRVTVD